VLSERGRQEGEGQFQRRLLGEPWRLWAEAGFSVPLIQKGESLRATARLAVPLGFSACTF